MVVPTLGERPDLLSKTLRSIRTLLCSEQVIVVAPPDAVDATRQRLSQLGAKVWPEDRPRRGLAAAVNDVWQKVSTPLVAWIGDDDLLRPGFTDAVRTLSNSTALSGVYGRMQIVDINGTVERTLRPGRIGLTLSRRGPNLIGQPGSIYRKEAVKDVGWLREDLPYSMDLDLFLRLDSWQAGLTYLPRVLGAFRWHESSQTVARPQLARSATLAAQDPPTSTALDRVCRDARLNWLAARAYYRWNSLLDSLHAATG